LIQDTHGNIIKANIKGFIIKILGYLLIIAGCFFIGILETARDILHGVLLQSRYNLKPIGNINEK